MSLMLIDVSRPATAPDFHDMAILGLLRFVAPELKPNIDDVDCKYKCSAAFRRAHDERTIELQMLMACLVCPRYGQTACSLYFILSFYVLSEQV